MSNAYDLVVIGAGMAGVAAANKAAARQKYRRRPHVNLMMVDAY